MANPQLTDTELTPAAALTPLFYSEEEAALLLGIHRTTLRHLAVDGKAPVPPVHITEHKRIYRRIDVERLAGVAT
ncbi:putative site-specific integrase-resolvase [Microbacterium sp. W4I4]|uniref:helix-turn-helix transcriptional regulator n=1 Tax=Microbacterium sp. W4I4 TaxID=3042295 RepID=UPI00277F6A55|nr:helix-turn-helix domain-containing protein [Microbacterium sp. W4I4]MDQ0614079.1 putative site-specific integrase-resolvase [Microbacterium sp. W4I4]